ncbi:D-sedoheptulose-7-phosphate isomerase [Thermodesulfatator autotrophicus]|uniref:Phosphoheptose isomerase n=1 Tax=Thermodesulfatator autotrophicus TaxID=1795632 RepID=A0A177E6D5_9BACT|nr:D-sedoheptulose 7-phosphate isomerase [Thermodesulfatator autotrophicus]OAG27523.1 phosphoheptose isomerase [Thermodesulfatator autotrophicus]
MENWQKQAQKILEESLAVKKAFWEKQKGNILRSAEEILRALKAGGKLLIFGNGGSAADAQHMAAEFVNRFRLERLPLPAIALTTDTSILTAIANDYDFSQVFSKQVKALGHPGDVALGISTSGNSENVLQGLATARELGLFTIGLTGGDGGKMPSYADLVITVPSRETPRIQEAHIFYIHLVCELVEEAYFAS